MIILTIVTLGSILYFYSNQCLNAPISTATRCGLGFLRWIFLATLLYLLTLPQLTEIITLVTSPILYIVLDDSLSMNYPIEPVTDGKTSPSRWDTTLQELTKNGMIANWEKKGFTLRFLPLSNSLPQPNTASSWSTQFPQSATPSSPQTDLGAAVDRFAETVSSKEPAYLLLFTDGRWNQGNNPLSAAAQLSASTQTLHPPIYTFGIGTALSLRDCIVDTIQFPTVARSYESLQFQAHLLVHGDLPSSPLTVRIHGENQAGDQIYEQEQSIPLPAEGNELSASFPIPQLDPGQYIFTIRVEPLPGEWIVENNQMSRGIQIRDAKDRILLLTSSPDWEFKFLKRVLENQDTLDVQSFFVHENGIVPLGDRNWIEDQSSTTSTPPEEKTNTAPILDELFQDLSRWPIIILHNFSFTLDQVESARHLREFVENGGGLIFLPGSSTTLNPPPALLDSLPAPIACAFSDEAKSVMLGNTLELESPYRIIQNDFPDLDLPPLENYTLPRVQSESGKVLLQGTASQNEPVSLITLYRYGLGRIVIMGSGSFWRWNLLTGKDILTPFWLTTLYQGNPQLQTQSGEIQTNGYLFNVFEPVQMTYRVGNRIGEATESTEALIVKSPSRNETIWLSPNRDFPNLFETRYTPVEPGTYHVATLTQDASTEFRVENTALELRDLRQNIDDLREVARITGGEYANQPAWQTLADRLPLQATVVREEQTRFLGEKWWMTTLLITFLGLEWFLRWRRGLP